MTRNNRKPAKRAKEMAIVDIDYNKLADAIVNAQDKATEKRSQCEKEKRAQENREWRSLFGYEEDKKITHIKAFGRLLFVHENEVKGDRATFALLQMSAEFIIGFAKAALYVFCAGCVLLPIYMLKNGINITLSYVALDIMMFILSFVYARLLRIAEIEIRHLTDREYLNTIIASITALVAMVLSVISLLK